MVSSLTDYLVGIGIGKSKSDKSKKAFLWISLIVNIGLLLSFKYFNFFIDSFNDLFLAIGYQASWSTLHIVLPVGISFYTFQTLSYTIDVYKGKLKPTNNLINFFTYVAFFPQLVAGPIERAVNLLPQIEKTRRFDYSEAKRGMKQILWGLFKKVVIADNIARIVDPVFSNYTELGTATLLLTLSLFLIQVYTDFSGYSDIAIGTSRLLGIGLMQNFAVPFFSRDMSEFWRRWHISLSTWFRDYIFFPLGGSRVKTWKIFRNILIVFAINGIWHGANWTFVIWGLALALFFIIELLGSRKEKSPVIAYQKRLPSLIELLQITKTFLLISFTMVLFRSPSISESYHYFLVALQFDGSLINDLDFIGVENWEFGLVILYIFILFLADYYNRLKEFSLERLPKSRFIRFFIYMVISLLILQYFYGENEYIYFQF